MKRGGRANRIGDEIISRTPNYGQRTLEFPPSEISSWYSLMENTGREITSSLNGDAVTHGLDHIKRSHRSLCPMSLHEYLASGKLPLTRRPSENERPQSLACRWATDGPGQPSGPPRTMDEEGRAEGLWHRFSLTSVAMELLTDSVKGCAGGARPGIGVITLGLLLGLSRGRGGKLIVDGLDSPRDPLSSALLALLARRKGLSVLSCVIGEGLDMVMG